MSCAGDGDGDGDPEVSVRRLASSPRQLPASFQTVRRSCVPEAKELITKLLFTNSFYTNIGFLIINAAEVYTKYYKHAQKVKVNKSV